MLRVMILSMALLMSLVPDVVFAAPNIGVASVVTGRVTVERAASASRQTRLEPGDQVFQGDRVRTQSDGSVKLTFRDGSTIRLSGGSDLLLNEFVYTPGSERKSRFDLMRGRMRAAVASFLSDSSVEVGTPTAVAGVRGTEFMVSVEDIASFGPQQDTETQVVVFHGQVSVRSTWEQAAEEVLLDAGHGSRVGRHAAPAQPQPLSRSELRQMYQTSHVREPGNVREQVMQNVVSEVDGQLRRSSTGVRTTGELSRSVAPPIRQESTDAHREPRLTIRIVPPEQR